MFSSRFPRLFRQLSSVLVLAGLMLAAGSSQADIMISPTRIVLDEKTSNATLTLRNPGTVARAYELRWSERVINAAGALERVEDGQNPRSAAQVVRYSPRRVVVEPGQLQTIRLDYRPRNDLAAGEYRSHLVIGLASSQSGTTVIEEQQGGISVQLKALISFSVPVIVRHGPGTASAAITSVAAGKNPTDNTPALQVGLTRAGEFSTYGRLMVYQQLDSNSPVVPIGQDAGVAIYAEQASTTRLVTLNPGAELKKGSWIRIVYEGTEQQLGQVFAERTLQITD